MKSATKLVIPAKWVLARCLLISAAALAISGCKTGDQPSAALAPVAEGAALTDAPAADYLPPAPAVPVNEVADAEEAYAFPDRAYEMSAMFGEAPPDYVYDYGNVQPWVWVSDDGSERVVEAVPGGERYYYYEAGADEPYFIQDPSYGYGFEGGRLVAVYDRSGRLLPGDAFAPRAAIAGRYLARARSLYDAGRQDRHQPVAENNWMTRRGAIAAQRQAWQQQASQDPNWRAFHAKNAPAVEAHWQNERVQRLNWAAHVDQTMHNQTYAAHEHEEAQNAAVARGPSPASSRPVIMEHAAAPPAPAQAPPERFAQHPPIPPGAAPQTARENFARQQMPARDNHPVPAASPSGPRMQPPPQVAEMPRHERQAPPASQAPVAPLPQQHVMPQQRMADVPRHGHEALPAPQAPAAPPQQQHVMPQQRMADVPRHEHEAPQAPAAPPPQQHVMPQQRMADVPRHEHQVPPAPQAPPPQPQAHAAAVPPHPAQPGHQQAAAPPANGGQPPGKDDKHKHG
jgi:hypothetical protein